MVKRVFGIEGLDRLGKSTLIEGIKNQLGFFQVVHFSKPEVLDAYEKNIDHLIPGHQLLSYQTDSFTNSMLIAKSGARVIFDRWHLGEVVYAPMYRGYHGDYVFDIERAALMDQCKSVRLILLTENFDHSIHFESDGESFDDSRRREEQEQFIQAFTRSIIPDKRIICVTGPDGNFRSKEEILEEALK